MYSTLSLLLNPLALGALAIAIALANLWRRGLSRRRVAYATATFAVAVLLCTPAIGFLALGTLEWSYPPQLVRPPGVEAIVVLGGYVRPADPPYARPEPELGTDSQDRCRLAAQYYRQDPPCVLVVCGGTSLEHPDSPTLARLMRSDLLQRGVAADDILMEDRSHSTYENAVEAAPLLQQRQISRIALVTDATHLRRAQACFQAQGLEVIPCGAYYRARDFSWSLSSFLPQSSAVDDIRRVMHEWLGIAWYRINGRI